MHPVVRAILQGAPYVWDGVLYDSGDEYADITGGWVISAANGSYTFSKTPTLSVTNNTGNYIGEFTTNKIDLTNFTSLKCNLTSKTGTVYLLASSVASYSATADAYTSAPGTGVVTVNVSALNGEYYVGTQVGPGTSQATITKMWLE